MQFERYPFRLLYDGMVEYDLNLTATLLELSKESCVLREKGNDLLQGSFIFRST